MYPSSAVVVWQLSVDKRACVGVLEFEIPTVKPQWSPKLQKTFEKAGPCPGSRLSDGGPGFRLQKSPDPGRVSYSLFDFGPGSSTIC